MGTGVPLFYQLMNNNDRILQSAFSSQSIQAFVDDVALIMQADIIIADALHYVLALSKSVQAHFSSCPDWMDLVSSGFVPPILFKQNVEDPTIMAALNHVDLINPDLVIHDMLKTQTGLHCNMSDIKENGKVTYKIAVTTEHPLSEEQRRCFLTFLEVTQLTIGQFKAIGSVNRHEFLLRKLIQGDLEDPVIAGPSIFDKDASYRMVCFDAEDLGVYHLTYLSGFNACTHTSHYLSAMIGNIHIVLFNTKYEYLQPLHFIEQFAKEHRFPALVSDEFDSVICIPYQYQELRDCASLASRFEGCIGLKSNTDFSMFRIFLKTMTADTANQFNHRDAQILCDYDCIHNTQYAQTLFRYLREDCEALPTADALFIHRNTLDNRLRKMTDLIKADWRDVNYKHQMLYSLFVHFYQKNELIW